MRATNYLAFLFIILFALIFVLVNFRATLTFDEEGILLIVNNRIPFLNPFFAYLSEYGREFVWIPVVALLWIFGDERAKKSALMLAIVFIFIIIVGEALKHFYYRPRPFYILNITTLVHRPTDSSFPSGHALIVIGGAVTLMLIERRKIWIPLFIEALLVSFSRIYVGVHWPTDVIAGSLLGAAIAILAVNYLYESNLFNRIFTWLNSVWLRII